MNATSEIDLRPFMAREDSRYAISHAFVRKGWRYATDGRICVRVPAVDEPDDDGKYPPAEDLFPKSDVSDWAPWPTDGFVEGDADCLVCEGRKRVNIEKCSACRGTGDCECGRCRATHECGICAGEGWIGGASCRNCRGAGREHRRIRQVIRGAHFGYEFVVKILALPNPLYSPSLVQPKRPIFFKFDGGEGLLMPLNPGSLEQS